MSIIQKALTPDDELRLGLVTKHDTPQSPHREHMGGRGSGGGFDLKTVSAEGQAAMRDAEEAGFFEGEGGVGMLEVNGVEIGEMDERSARDIAANLKVPMRSPGRAVSEEYGPGYGPPKGGTPSGQPLPGAAPPAGDMPDSREQGGGGGHRAYRGERGRERGSTSQDDPSQQTGAEAYTGERAREQPSLEGPSRSGPSPGDRMKQAVTKATVASTGAVLALHDTPNSPHREHARGAKGGGESEQQVQKPSLGQPTSEDTAAMDEVQEIYAEKDSWASDMSDEDLSTDMTHMRDLIQEFGLWSPTADSAREQLGDLKREKQRRDPDAVDNLHARRLAEQLSGEQGGEQEQRPSGQPLPGAAPPAGDMPDSREQGGGGGHRMRGNR